MALNPDKNGLIWIDDLSGGLNDTDAPQAIGDTQCQVAQNVEWVTTRFAQRRQGGTNGIHATEPWGTGGTLNSLMRHTPTADEGAAEMWAVSFNAPAVLGRMAAGNQFVSVSVGDAWTEGTLGATLQFINGVTLNGKFFIAGDTSVDRLHVWDGTSLRRVGLATPAAPTAANTGAGTYPATTRYYKVQWYGASGVAGRFRFSELSPALTFTPSGTGTHVRITQPTPPGEGETGWRIYGSPDNVNFYEIAGPAIGTTTFDDNTNPALYSTVTPASAGFPTDPDYFTPPMSPKYLLADEDRLILLSSWETSSAASAVMWTPVLNETDPAYLVADEERVPAANRLDVDRSDGGGITGGGVINGTVYVFKLSHIYRLRRTGDAALPYQPIVVTKSLGAISHKSIVAGEDAAGNECLYFLSRRGPYRLTTDGLEYIGRDIETTWGGINLASARPPFGVWHQEKRQVQWWVTTTDSTNPDKKLVFHARHARRTENGDVRGGWAVHTEGAAAAYCAVMFANTLGATMSLDLKPYVGQVWMSGLPDGPCIKYDATGTYTDRGGNATTYIARVKGKAFPPAGPGRKGGVTLAYVLGSAANRALAIDVIRDFNAETRSGSATLPAPGSSTLTRACVKVEDDARCADGMFAELIVDDEVSPPSSAAWAVDAVGLRVRDGGAV